MLPKLANIQAATAVYQQLQDWQASNAALTQLFALLPGNTGLSDVLVKLAAVNSLYGTNLMAQVAMGRHIVGLSGLDYNLASGDIDTVDAIAQLNGRKHLSFASKYAHFHNKVAYPLYDRYVWNSVRHFMRDVEVTMTGRGSGKASYFTPDSYEDFVAYYALVVEQAGLANGPNWEDLDRYMWLYGLKRAMDGGEKKISREVRALYVTLKGKQLMDQLEPV